MPPVKPMLAKPQPRIPTGQLYEPKWDGFRGIVFRDGDDVEIGSRNERPMTRYFPELVEELKSALPPPASLTGESVSVVPNASDSAPLHLASHPPGPGARKLA